MELFFIFLGGLLLSVQDSAAAEEVEQVTQPDITGYIPNSTPTNLLSSGTFSGEVTLIFFQSRF